MHEVLVNRLGGLSLPRKSVVRLTDRPDMTLDVYCGRKATIQQQKHHLREAKYLLLQERICSLWSKFFPVKVDTIELQDKIVNNSLLCLKAHPFT